MRTTRALHREERLLEIIDDVLARADEVPAAEQELWERLVQVLEGREESPYSIPASAAAANLVGLALFGAPGDHLGLADLAEELGHVRLAQLQHEYGGVLVSHTGVPLTTAAVRRIVDSDLQERLAAHPATAGRAEAIDRASLRAARALLVRSVDHEPDEPVAPGRDPGSGLAP